MQPNEHAAVVYLKTLFSEDDGLLCISLLSSTKKFANGQPLVKNIFLPLEKVIAPAGIERLTALNRTNHIFVSMYSFKEGTTKRIKSQIERVAHCFVDADDDGPKVLASIRAAVAAGTVPQPHLIVESSENKFQAIWNIADFDVPLQEALNKTLCKTFGTDAQVVDATRVLRIAGFANIKSRYPDPKPIAKIIERHFSFLPYGIEDFKIALTVQPDRTVHVAAANEEVQGMIELLEAALMAAGVVHRNLEPWADAFKFVLETCPWGEFHANGLKGDAMCGVMPSGRPFFKCLHKTCAEREWVKDFRPHLEKQAQKKLRFKVTAAKKQTTRRAS